MKEKQVVTEVIKVGEWRASVREQKIMKSDKIMHFDI